MRYSITFDGLTALDPGRAIPAIQLDHEATGTPAVLQGSVIDFLVRRYDDLRSLALNLLIQQHCQLFPYEDGDNARDQLETLLDGAGAGSGTSDQADQEPWMIGNALRLELVIKAPEFKLIDHADQTILAEFVIMEMMRNAYRRLHRLEQPLGAWFFQVFMQTGQPTQVPMEILYDSVIDGRQPSKSEAVQIMRENSVFWKAELQELANAFLAATCHDPALLTLQNAATYQRLKQFFNEDGE